MRILRLLLLLVCVFSASAQTVIYVAPDQAGTQEGRITMISRDGYGSGTVKGVTFYAPATLPGGAYQLIWPTTKPALNELLKAVSEPSTGTLQLDWAGAGSGTAIGGTGAVQLSLDGTGTFFGDATKLVFDQTNFWLGINTPTPLHRLHLLTGAGGSGIVDGIRIQYGSNIGDGGGLVFGNTPTAMGARIAARTSSGSTIDLEFTAFGGSKLVYASAGDLVLDNNRAYSIKDAGGTDRRLVHLDTVNNLNVGVNVSGFGTGGDLVLFSSHSGTPTVVEFVTPSGGSAYFGPKLAHPVTLGGSGVTSEPWSGAYLQGQVQIDTDGAIVAAIAIEDISNGGKYTTIRRAAGGANHTLTLPNANAAGALTNDGSGNLSYVAGGGFTCNTAGNCFDLTTAQTAAGNKTFTGTTVFGTTAGFATTTTFNVEPNATFGRSILMGAQSGVNPIFAMRNSSFTEEVVLQTTASSNLADSFLIRNSSGTLRLMAGVTSSGAASNLTLFTSTSGEEIVLQGSTNDSVRGIYIDGDKIIGGRETAVANCTDTGNSGCVQLNLLLARLRTHGLIAP